MEAIKILTVMPQCPLVAGLVNFTILNMHLLNINLHKSQMIKIDHSLLINKHYVKCKVHRHRKAVKRSDVLLFPKETLFIPKTLWGHYK